MKNTLLALVALLCFTFGLAAASVDGKWTAEVPGRGGNTQTQTYTFKADGGNVTGMVTTQRGDTPIADGKLSGDALTFTVTMPGRGGGADQKVEYKGKVGSDSIELTFDRGRGPQTITAKKAN
jgi:hypothetical protein